MVEYKLKYEGEKIDKLLEAVDNGSVVVSNTVSVIESGNGKPVSSNAIHHALDNKVDKADGMGLSEWNYTGADRDAVATVKDGSVITNHADKITDIILDNTDADILPESKNPVSGEAVSKELAKKANTTEYYPTMSVGKADNLVGRGDVQDAMINFRPSGGVLGVGNGMNISDGASRIERIKGNSVVYNQRWSKVQGDWMNTRTESILTDVGVKITATDGYAKSHKTRIFPFTVGHKAAITLMAKVKGKILLGAYQGATADQAYLGVLEGDGESWKEYTIVQLTVTVNTLGVFIERKGNSIEIDENSIRIADLTQMFGVDSEPTTVEEYLQRKPMNVEDEFAYNNGELINMKVDSLISTSDNAYDYTKGYAKVMGGYTYDCSYGATFVEKVYFSTEKDNIVAEENVMTSENGEYTFPSDGYAVPYTTDGDVREYCVCLQHTYTKPHPPYQQVVKSLSFIGEIFPNGMRSAGSVYDEIRFNPTKKKWEKVTRIGVAKVGDLNWHYTDTEGQQRFTSYDLLNELVPASSTNKVGNIVSDKYTAITDNMMFENANDMGISVHTGGSIGVKHLAYTNATTFKNEMADAIIYYELAETIVVELDYPTAETNMDYFAWDFGTEEAIAPSGDDDKPIASAPFRADINYEPNAVDDLRWAISEIRSLRAQIAQLQSTQVSDTNLME